MTSYQDFVALGIYPELTRCANELLRISYGVIHKWERVRVQTFTPKLRDFGTNGGLGLHRDGNGRLSGITALFTAGRDLDEMLVTQGRGNLGHQDKPKRYKYTNGPIIVAQTDWAKSLLGPSQPAGATWHTGLRQRAARVGALDFLLH